VTGGGEKRLQCEARDRKRPATAAEVALQDRRGVADKDGASCGRPSGARRDALEAYAIDACSGTVRAAADELEGADVGADLRRHGNGRVVHRGVGDQRDAFEGAVTMPVISAQISDRRPAPMRSWDRGSTLLSCRDQRGGHVFPLRTNPDAVPAGPTGSKVPPPTTRHIEDLRPCRRFAW
jgi:hypothetical protein